ncbi:MAG: hypothetical protein GF405_05555 [Candidatus Eisenbacteria bacterium]|nr:hypothetical protein [Candidatus Eisenbacteria bacterium]
MPLRPFSDTSMSTRVFAVELPQDHRLSVLFSENTGTPNRDRARVVALDNGPGDPKPLCDGLLLGAYRTLSDRELRLLCWRTSLGYEEVSRDSRLTPADLFLLNYSREKHMDRELSLLRALRRAARRESLRADCFLETRSPDGSLVSQTRIEPNRNPLGGMAVELADRSVVLVGFNNGYQVSESLYRELALPSLEARSFESRRALVRKYGSFRGVMAVDLETGGLLWERPLGVNNGAQPAVVDLTGDGVEEIVLSTYSPANGVSARGTTDLGYSYILCLDASGRELWRHRRRGWFTGTLVSVADVTGDGRPDVVAVWASTKDRQPARVTVISGEGQLVAERPLVGAGGLVLADVTGDGASEILVGESTGRLLALDGRLRTTCEGTAAEHTGFRNRHLMPLAANDLDGDGRMEVVAASVGWTIHEWNTTIRYGSIEPDSVAYLVVLDGKLRELARCETPNRKTGWGWGLGRHGCLVADLDDSGTNEIILGPVDGALRFFELVPEGDAK